MLPTEYIIKNCSWCLLFSHPADFTPVCTTELARTAELIDEFSRRNVKPLALSVDPVSCHLQWIPDVEKVGNGIDIKFPIIADDKLAISYLYSMIHPGESLTATVRSVFVIDPENTIRCILAYPITVGRNFTEILRILDALQIADKAPVATPVDWQVGNPVILNPNVSTREGAQLLHDLNEVFPYLRYGLLQENESDSESSKIKDDG